MTKSIRYIIVLVGLLAGIGSCKKFDTMLENPNLPAPNQADVNLYLNNVQLNFASFFNQAQSFGAQLTRQTVFFGPTYQNGYSPQSFDGVWSTAYTGVLKNVNAMIPLAKQQARFFHAGIGEVLKAYTLMTLVDMFGDVPFSEANQGNENLNPKVDNGSAIYAAAIALLDEAIADFGKASSSNPTTILFNNASTASWTRVANSLKLRAYITTRLVDNQAGAKIKALVDAGNLITADADEFTFKYGTNQATPNSRHPRYNEGYVASGGASTYIANQFLETLVFGKPNSARDPRWRYYIYRQASATITPTLQQKPCAASSLPAHYTTSMPYCYIGAGFWGRDHADNSGIPPDGNLRTIWGVYPAGGRMDCNEGLTATLTEGGRGAGIAPIWMSFFTNFVLAEAALTTTGYGGDARAQLEAGITKSINRVRSFPASIGAPAPCPASDASVAAYVNFVLAEYDAATTTNAKLDIIAREYWLALWGNGTEAYNLYRRTGKPKLSVNGGAGLQFTVLPNPGPFIRSFLYPSVFVNLNSNAKQKQNWTTRVFWDTNPDALQ